MEFQGDPSIRGATFQPLAMFDSRYPQNLVLFRGFPAVSMETKSGMLTVIRISHCPCTEKIEMKTIENHRVENPWDSYGIGRIPNGCGL